MRENVDTGQHMPQGFNDSNAWMIYYNDHMFIESSYVFQGKVTYYPMRRGGQHDWCRYITEGPNLWIFSSRRVNA